MASVDATDSLVAIQQLQFRDRKEAEARLFRFLAADLPGLQKVVINTKPESLNSINGFLVIDDSELFFKSHTESHETDIGGEDDRHLYNTALLEKVGYPVVMPDLVQTLPGRQIAIYRKVDLETLFDLAKRAEDAALAGAADAGMVQTLVGAQRKLDAQIRRLYESTLEASPRATVNAPIHQLFHERLQPGRRVDEFYAGSSLVLAKGALRFEDLASMQWTINGVSYDSPIGELIEQSRRSLDPKNETAVVCGHGDGHNGNVWVDGPDARLLYFDAAFAGYHDPLLDLVKPVFHNVFARWMYFPTDVEKEFEIDYHVNGRRIEVHHDFQPSLLRRAFFDSKIEEVISPLLDTLRARGLLRPGWRQALRSALFCCPFLTVNLAAAADPGGKLEARYTPAIRLLGLSLAIEMGSEASNETESPIRGYLRRLTQA